jgi:hypothetical protein
MAPPDSGSPGVTRSTDRGSRRLTLHLGVLVQPYRSSTAKAGSLTTVDVAEILEAKYGVMEAFYRVHKDVVMGAVARSMEGALESLLMGRRVDTWGSATQLIQSEFRRFISSREAEKVGIPGTPTKAALRGVNHRLKHPYAKRNARRPSFRDTGLYMASFRAWVD